MAFDGIITGIIGGEINALSGAKVEKIFQPSREEIVLLLRGDGQTLRLLMSANPSCPRVHFTEEKNQNPTVAPNFCMLLRKHLGGGRLLRVEQEGAERALSLIFECRNELSESVERRLIVEIMGRYSNIILTTGDGLILDAIRHADLTTSSKRQILPGLKYFPPPPQEKEIISSTSEISAPFTDKELLARFMGLSPAVCREVVVMGFNRFKEMLLGRSFSFCMASSGGRPVEFSYIPLLQYGEDNLSFFPSCSALIDAFYSSRSTVEFIRQYSADILQSVNRSTERLARKIELQRAELKKCDEAEIYKKYGDMITSNLYLLKGGETSFSAIDYSDPEMKEISVPLFATMTPSRSAQKYYKLYKKAQTARVILKEQIESALSEIEYLDSVAEALSRAKTSADLSAIRGELSLSGYLSKSAEKSKKEKKPKDASGKPLVYSFGGYRILAGRNNLQNEALTFRVAEKSDIWCHIKDRPGAHVIILCEGQNPPDEVIGAALRIAAFNSKGRGAEKVAVDFTAAKNVKKIKGAKPGLVIYDSYNTAYVTASESEMAEMLVSE